MRTILLPFALLFSSLLVAQTEPPATPDQKSPERCSIDGAVTRADNGLPLRKVTIAAAPEPRPSSSTPPRPVVATTDVEGKFALNLPPGRYILIASRAGFLPTIYGQRLPNGPGTPLTLAPGEHLKDIAFRLQAGSAISGRIVDEDSDPLVGVRVQALRWGYRNGKRQLVHAGGSSSDDRGEYRIHSLAPGRYYLSASYSGPGYGYGRVGLAVGSNLQDYAATYYPGVNDASQATAIELRPGDDIPGINFRLVPGHAVRIAGRVQLPASQPSRAGLSVSLVSRRPGGAWAGWASYPVDAKQGTFEIPAVAPGSYVLLVNSDEFKPGAKSRLQGRLDLEVGNSDIDDVLLVLRPGVEIAGQLRLEGAADLDPARLRFSLIPEDSLPMGGGFTDVKSDFTFSIPDVADGDYRLYLDGLPEDVYLSSARFGVRDVLRDGLSLRGRGGSLDITVSATGGRLTGAVVNDRAQPFAGATVVLVPDESSRIRSDLYRRANSDQYGRFTLRGVAPGKYKAFAWETIEPGAYQDPDFLRAYEDLGQSVDVAPSSRTALDLKVIPATKTGP